MAGQKIVPDGDQEGGKTIWRKVEMSHQDFNTPTEWAGIPELCGMLQKYKRGQLPPPQAGGGGGGGSGPPPPIGGGTSGEISELTAAMAKSAEAKAKVAEEKTKQVQAEQEAVLEVAAKHATHVREQMAAGHERRMARVEAQHRAGEYKVASIVCRHQGTVRKD